MATGEFEIRPVDEDERRFIADPVRRRTTSHWLLIIIFALIVLAILAD